MAVCAICGRACRLGRSCACQASQGAATATRTGPIVAVSPLLRMPQPERVDGVVRSIRSARRATSDRSGWARILEVLGLLPILVVVVFVAAVGITVRMVGAMLRGRRRPGGGITTLSHGMSLVDRARKRGSSADPSVVVLELDTKGGAAIARLPVEPVQVPLQPGDHVTVVARGRSQGVLRAVRVESTALGVIAAPSPFTARAVIGTLLLAFLVLAIVASTVS